MKTVSGAVVSSKPVSLSKAAKILSKFALADNGASPTYIAYLKRASDSFGGLVQFHKELRGSGSERKSKSKISSVGYDQLPQSPLSPSQSLRRPKIAPIAAVTIAITPPPLNCPNPDDTALH